jgi:hypothetical protein
MYHQACVFKAGPLTFDAGDAIDIGVDGAYTSTDPWFCPSHVCFNCAAVEEMAFTLPRVEMPISLLASAAGTNTTAGSSRRLIATQRPLKICTSCPLAACQDCVAEIGKTCHVFDNKRREQVL